jgi:oligosaccharide reducing-end xylanase
MVKASCWLLISGCIVQLLAQSVDAPYEVGTWQGFRSAAVTYTFDDQCANQFTHAVPLFDAKGFKATFYPVINWGVDWNKLKALAANGHEIGSHTMSHPDLSGSQNQESELRESKAETNRQIPGNQCITIAYPYCNAGTVSLVSKYYIAGRTCQGQIESKTPQNFYGISSITCGSQGTTKSLENLNERVNEAANSNGWCVFLVHEVNNGNGYSPIAASAIEGNLNYLSQNKGKFWVSTFSNVVRYIKERNAVQIRSVPSETNRFILRVTDNLLDSIYNYPITIRRPIPANWDTVIVSQDEVTIESSVITVNGNRYVMFDAVPDKGDIVIAPALTSVQNKLYSNESHTSDFVKRMASGLQIDTRSFSGSKLKVNIAGLDGKIIRTYSIDKESTGKIFLPQGKLKRSSFIVQVTDGSKTASQVCIAID